MHGIACLPALLCLLMLQICNHARLSETLIDGRTLEFDKNDLIFKFHCCILIPEKCPSETPFQHTVLRASCRAERVLITTFVFSRLFLPQLILSRPYFFSKKIPLITKLHSHRDWVSTRWFGALTRKLTIIFSPLFCCGSFISSFNFITHYTFYSVHIVWAE